MKSRLNTLREIEDELNIRLHGHSPQPKGSDSGTGRAYWEFRSGHGGMDHRMRQIGRRGSHGSGGGVNPRQQRVVVKASYTVHKAGGGVLRAHVRYLGRDSASLDGEPGRFYDVNESDVDAGQCLRNWERDRHHFRFIVSPQYGDQIEHQPGGLTGYIRELMAQVERDLAAPGSVHGSKLEWVAINHHNTDEAHSHILVRGRRQDGQDLVIPRDYIKRGMRNAAQAIATRRLGERTHVQMREQRQQELQAQRYTPLDATIERHLDSDHRLRLKVLARGGEVRRRVASRLAHLEEMGLACRDRHGRWMVDAELKPKLRELAVRDDIIKNLYPRLGPRSGSVAVFRAEEKELLGYAAGTGTHDELRDQRYLLVRDGRRQLHYVRVANAEALHGLEEGGLVRVLAGDPQRARTDARIAAVARDNGGIYSREAHRRSLPAYFAAGDVEGYLRSHERRLQTLERAGAVARLPGELPGAEGKDGWTVRDLDSLARGEQARNREGAGTVEVVSARSIQSQVNAQAWTWLDRQIHRQAQGNPRNPRKPTAVSFDQVLEQAAEARRKWMVEHGYAEMRDGRYAIRAGAAEALRRQEWRAVQQEQQSRFGPRNPRSPGSPRKPVRPLSAGAEATGAYQGVIALHDGLHAVIVEHKTVALAPVKRVPPLAYGTPVAAKVNSRGQAILSRVNKQRQRERDLERD